MMYLGLNKFRRYKITAQVNVPVVSTTSVDVASQSFESKGGGVLVALYHNPATTAPLFLEPASGSPGGFTIEFCRDDVVFHAVTVYAGRNEAGAHSYSYSATEFWAIDRAIGGSYVYKVKARVNASGTSLSILTKMIVAQGML